MGRRGRSRRRRRKSDRDVGGVRGGWGAEGGGQCFPGKSVSWHCNLIPISWGRRTLGIPPPPTLAVKHISNPPFYDRGTCPVPMDHWITSTSVQMKNQQNFIQKSEVYISYLFIRN